MRFTPKANLFDDSFELMICATRSRLLYLAYVSLALAGRIQWVPHAHFLKTTSLRCEPLNGESTWLQVDGEPAGRLPAEFNIIPDALTLVVPRAIHSAPR